MDGCIPDVASLLESIQAFENLPDPSGVLRVYKAFGLPHEQLGVNVTVQVGIVHINGVQVQAMECSNDNNHSLAGHSGYRCKGVMEVPARLLSVALGDQSGFVAQDNTFGIPLQLEDPFTANGVSPIREWAEEVSSLAFESSKFFYHGCKPFSALGRCQGLLIGSRFNYGALWRRWGFYDSEGTECRWRFLGHNVPWLTPPFPSPFTCWVSSSRQGGCWSRRGGRGRIGR